MDTRKRIMKSIRWLLGLLLALVGLSMTWAWGEVAPLAGPSPSAEQPPATALYAAWQRNAGEQRTLFRSIDEGVNWIPLALPTGVAPRVWADDGGKRLAVVTGDGSVFQSNDHGDTWTAVAEGLLVSSLVWDKDGGLYLGTSGQGIYRLATDGILLDITTTHGELALAQVVDLSLAGGHLFAATPTVLFHTEDWGATWTKTMPLPERVTAVAASDPQTIYAGTATVGVYKSSDSGRTWQPAWDGLGLAAGQMVRVTALCADPSEPGLLYVAVDHVVGSTHVHASAAGVFVTVDGGASWEPLAGPAFPEAKQALGLVVVSGKPLYVQAVTSEGMQGYAPDLMRLVAALESDDSGIRASAARQLGLAQPLGLWNELLAALDDPDPAVSLAAADALGRIKDAAAVPGLLITIEHPSEQIRLQSARALGMMGVEAAVEPLRTMLLWGEGLEVSVAGEALGRIGGSMAIDALLVALADPQPTARWHVAMAALEEMGETAVAPLVTMLDSQDALARRNAAQALGWIGSSSATEALMRALKRDGDETVRSQAAWALGEIGDPAAWRALERAKLRDSAVEVQTAAEWALARVPVQSEAASSWTVRWVPTVSRLQPLRWLVLALSLSGAAWLIMGNESLALQPLRLRVRHRQRTAKRTLHRRRG
jgi:HEAT repeat protein